MAVIVALDDRAIDRILDQVGPRFLPKQLDRDSLRLDIEHVWDFYRGFSRDSGKGLRSKRHKLISQISKHADELLRLLNQPANAEWLRKHLGQAYPVREGSPIIETIWDTAVDGSPVNFRGIEDPSRKYDEPSFHGLKAGLSNLSAVATRVARSQVGDSAMRQALKASPRKWLIGHDLAHIYESYTGRIAGRGRSAGGGKPGGPFVRFAVAILGEFGEQIANDTVEAALKEIRSLKRQGD